MLVEPKYAGNIGAVARSMMNFDFNHLVLVNPCELNDECYNRAMHAHKILDTAQTHKNVHDATKNLDFLVATSSIDSLNDKHHLRNAVSIVDFVQKIAEVQGKIGLLFGREDFGLLNEEIAQCDMMIKIPTSKQYPSLNLSHAVNLILYSLYITQETSDKQRRIIGDVEDKKLHDYFACILDEINYPTHKKEKTKIMFRRLIGRAIPSTWEYHTLMGVLSRTLEKIKK